MSDRPEEKESPRLEKSVREALSKVVDPEVGINVVELGLVYAIEQTTDGTLIRMTTTSPLCPLRRYVTEEAQRVVSEAVPQARPVRVELVWDPPWNPSMMSESARESLGWGRLGAVPGSGAELHGSKAPPAKARRPLLRWKAIRP